MSGGANARTTSFHGNHGPPLASSGCSIAASRRPASREERWRGGARARTRRSAARPSRARRRDRCAARRSQGRERGNGGDRRKLRVHCFAAALPAGAEARKRDGNRTRNAEGCRSVSHSAVISKISRRNPRCPSAASSRRTRSASWARATVGGRPGPRRRGPAQHSRARFSRSSTTAQTSRRPCEHGPTERWRLSAAATTWITKAADIVHDAPVRA